MQNSKKLVVSKLKAIVLLHKSCFQDWSPNTSLEPLRFAIENEATSYTLNHYRHGICSAFSVDDENGKAVVLCIEDHQFQPKNFW